MPEPDSGDQRPLGTISIDLDSAATHLAGYGVEVPHGDRLLPIAVERILPLLERHRARATFFTVVGDLPDIGELLGAIVAAGHEVASHSMTHPSGLSRLPADRLAVELGGARDRLAEAIGADVAGFRAPSWDVRRRTLRQIAEAGYRYDASVLPSPWLPAARLLVAAKARSPRAIGTHALLPPRLLAVPYRLGTLVEFPVSVTPRLRWPIYHTTRYGMDDRRFTDAIEALSRARTPISYPFHAIDAVGVTEDGLDPRLARHPGADRSREAKLDLLDRTIELLGRHYRLVPFAERMAEAAPS